MTRPNAICHVEIPAGDLAVSTAFYEKVFGWTVELLPSGNYALFTEAQLASGFGDTEPRVSGGFDPNREPEGGCRGVLLYIACEDIPSKLAEIGEAGGETVQPKTEIGGNYGYYAHFRDPAGNLMGVWCMT